MNTMIKVISFDIGGTLLFNKDNNKYNLKKLSSLTKVDYDYVRKTYKDIFQKTKGSLAELENLFCEKLQIKLTDEIHNFFINKISNNTNTETNKDFTEVVKQLKQKGYKIILFSNSCCLIQSNLSPEFLKEVDYVFYSYDLGYTKDEEESYRLIEKNASLQ